MTAPPKPPGRRTSRAKAKASKLPPDVLTPGSFAARVESRRVDLVSVVDTGIPPREYHAHSDGMFVKGKRHHISAPYKEGKSIVFESHWARVALAGEVVVPFDLENGTDESARRLASMMDSWALTPAQRGLISQNLIYHDWPVLKSKDGPELAAYCADELGADIVVFDSQRMFLTSYGLKESDADDYADFMEFAINPLHRAGITTVILDNTGWADKTRARGTISKGDLNEVLFYLKADKPFDKNLCGRVKLVTQRGSRFGDRGEWTMEIGGGVFGEWKSTAQRLDKVAKDKPQFKAMVFETLRTHGEAWGQDKILEAVRGRGVKIKTATARSLLTKWVGDENEPIRHTSRGFEFVAPVTAIRVRPSDGTGGTSDGGGT